ncbi:hypothetical protein B0H34DRAFT_810107 [Crassisporium funariophilum]|nr:hypothetical protein B0H34DRAFT_810107 [Crassisporium funariophilum]
MLWFPYLVLGLAQLCASKSLLSRWDDISEKHSWVDIPRGWAYHAPAPAEHLFNLTIGTDGSSSIAASVFALLNDYRLLSGKEMLGFINPLIYSIGSTGFADVTSGTNPGCNTPGKWTWERYLRVSAVTGLGTPNFVALQGLI